MSVTDANPPHPTFIDDYVLHEVDLDWMAKSSKRRSAKKNGNCSKPCIPK